MYNKNLLLLNDEDFIESLTNGSELNYNFTFRAELDKTTNRLILSNTEKSTNLDNTNQSKKSRLVEIKEFIGINTYVSMNVYSYNAKHSIMIYLNCNDAVYKGSLLKIHMLKKEYKQYVDFFVRNYNLIYFIRFTNGMYNDYFYELLLRDESLRSENYIVKRNKYTGVASIYDSNNNLLYTNNDINI